MRRHILGQTGIEVPHLGFGCVRLTSHSARHEAVAILEDAFAHGITHFDVARAYGFGRAEGILGEFLQGKRSRVTIATKFGIQPPSGLAGNRRLIDLSKKVLGLIPGVLQRAKRHASTLVQSGVFTPEAAVSSLETSLRELRTDSVDFLLLHEAELADAQSTGLIEALQQQVQRGTVRCFGVASDFHKVGQHLFELPAPYQLVQFEDNGAARNLQGLHDTAGRGCITHSIFRPAEPLQRAIAAQPDIARKYSEYMNVDLNDAGVIHTCLLRYALCSNPEGIVLFSSTDRQHLANNVREGEAYSTLEDKVSIFTEFVDSVLNTKSRSTDPSSAPAQQAS